MLGLGYPTLSSTVLETTQGSEPAMQACYQLSHGSGKAFLCLYNTNSNFRKSYVHPVKQGVETINFSKICISWTGLKQSTQFATLGCSALLTQTPGTPCSGRFFCDVQSQLQRFLSTLGQPFTCTQPASASMGPGGGVGDVGVGNTRVGGRGGEYWGWM